MTEVHLDNVDITVKQSELLKGISFGFKTGELVAILGPNGAGKTSLLRAALGYIPAHTGEVRLEGQAISEFSALERAQLLAYLPQKRELAWPNKVRDVVALGRYAYGAQMGRLKAQDEKAVSAAMQACDIEHLQDRRTDTLSGGELARMHCARAFASHAPLLLADEPVAALDPRHQFKVMELLKSYVQSGQGVCVVLHDVSLAARFADRLVWMKEGRIIADGTVKETLSSKRLEEIYNVQAEVKGYNVQIKGAL